MSAQNVEITINSELGSAPKAENLGSDSGNNTFFKKLEEDLNKKDALNLNAIRNPDFELHRETTVTKNSYNTAGNLSLSCYIPIKPNNPPNFVGLIINDASNAGNNPNHPLMRVLLDWVKDKDMLTYYIDSTTAANANGVPTINLKTIITSKDANYVLRWWNAGRVNWCDKGGDEEADKLCQIYAHRLNALFSHVINTDLTTPDNKFKELVQNLFVYATSKRKMGGISGDTFSFMPYSGSTLMLPSLVNYITNTTKNIKENALSYCGFVPKNTKVFVSNCKTAEDFQKMNDKFNAGNLDIMTSSIDLININESLSKVGKYNYPLTPGNAKSDNNSFMPLTATHDNIVKLFEQIDTPPLQNLKVLRFRDTEYSKQYTDNYAFNAADQKIGTHTNNPKIDIRDNDASGASKTVWVKDLNKEIEIKIPIVYFLSDEALGYCGDCSDMDLNTESKAYSCRDDTHGNCKNYDRADDACRTYFIGCLNWDAAGCNHMRKPGNKFNIVDCVCLFYCDWVCKSGHGRREGGDRESC